MAFSNEQSAHYRSSVTNEPRKVTDRCPLLITQIRNGHQITTITTTSHRSCEMAVSLSPQGTLVMGTHYSSSILDTHVVYLRLLQNETRLFHARLNTSRIHSGHQTTIVTITSHQSREMAVSLGPHRTLVTGMKTEPATVKSTSETRAVNRRLLCLDEMRRIYFHARLLSLD
jgi:S-adenosylmethionine:tRNA-ribosyltransferase-isomerase (queuine synthetase)